MTTNVIPDEPNPATAASEPLIAVGLATTVITAAVSLLVAFGLHVNNDQKAAVIGFIAALAPLVTALWGRGKVWSPLSVARALAAVRASQPPAAPPPVS